MKTGSSPGPSSWRLARGHQPSPPPNPTTEASSSEHCFRTLIHTQDAPSSIKGSHNSRSAKSTSTTAVQVRPNSNAIGWYSAKHQNDRPITISLIFTIFPFALRHYGAIMAPMMKAAKDSRSTTERITVRLPDHMLAAIDAECSRRIGNVSRNTWILEAVQEKLSRTGGGENQQSDVARGS